MGRCTSSICSRPSVASTTGFAEITQEDVGRQGGCLASEMESAALFIAGSFLHVRVGACFLVLANQEREKRGLPNVQVHDTTQAIATTVDAIRLLIQEDKDADRL